MLNYRKFFGGNYTCGVNCSLERGIQMIDAIRLVADLGEADILPNFPSFRKINFDSK